MKVEDQQYVLNPSLKTVFCGEDEVLVLHGARSDFHKNLFDEGRNKLLSRVLREMNTPTSLSTLLEREVIKAEEMDTAIELVDYLSNEHILADPQAHPSSLYLQTVHGQSVPLSALTVGVVGTRYLGGRIAQELANLRVGQLILQDDRTMDGHTVDRLQFPAGADTIAPGKPYTEGMKEQLGTHGYDTVRVVDASIYDKESLQEVFSNAHFVVVAEEFFSSRLLHTVNTVALDTGKPWLSAFVDGSEACVGPIYVPGETCCYNCFEVQCEAALPVRYENYFGYKELVNTNGMTGAPFSVPAHLSTASGFAVSALLTFLGYGRSYLVGRALRLNFEKPYVDYEEVLWLPRCPACASLRNGYRHTFM